MLAVTPEHDDAKVRFRPELVHRREHARTDWDNDGQPRHEWEELLAEMRRRADKAGHLQFALGFQNLGARLKLTVKSPGGKVLEQEGDSTFTIDVPDAEAGD